MVIYNKVIIKVIKAVRVVFWIYNIKRAIVFIDQIFIMKEKKEKSQMTAIKISKIMLYILVMFILGLVLFLLSLKSVLKYNEWPIYTETNIVNQNQARLPAMTFCPLSNGYKGDVLKVRSKNYISKAYYTVDNYLSTKFLFVFFSVTSY